MKKETRSQIEKRKYTAVRNAYGDVKLAQKSRGWSNERIFQELGVRIPKSMPTLKPLPTPKQYIRKQRLLKKYIYARQIGLEPVQAVKLKQYKKTRIESTKQYNDQNELPLELRTNILNKNARIKLWQDWARMENLPPEVHQFAKEINEETTIGGTRLDDTDHYGYAVMFYAFVEQEGMNSVMEWFKPDSQDFNLSGMIVKQT